MGDMKNKRTAAELRYTPTVAASAVADHRCPTCYVGPGRWCVAISMTHPNRRTKTHAARLRLAATR